jgi:hypothetical protein
MCFSKEVSLLMLLPPLPTLGCSHALTPAFSTRVAQIRK